jgi:drug/metabolite transporter (DMT)-like permease
MVCSAGITVAYSKTLPPEANFWRNNQALLSEVAFLAIVAIWGISFVFTKNALEVIGPFAYNTLRMALGTIILALLAGRRDWQTVNRYYFWPALITGFLLFLVYESYTYGQQLTTASKAGFLSGTNVIYVPVLSALLLRRMPSLTTIAGVILTFIGLSLLSLEGSITNLAFAPGDLWVALGSVFWAFYIIALAYYSPYLNLAIYATLHVFVATLINGVGWLFFEPLSFPATSIDLWIGVISTGVFIIGLGTSIQTWIVRMISPTRLALISAIEPVFAAMAGWWIGEIITRRIITGGTLIIIGMLVAELRHILKWRR